MTLESKRARIINGHMQAGVAQKGLAEITVEFEKSFVHAPVVVITPAWIAGVGAAETLHSVTRDSFTLFSGDAAPDYYVHWIAVGEIEGVG